MRRRVLPVLGAVLTLGAAAQAVMLVDGPARLRANAEPAELMAGCTDVPEAAALADTLRQRGLRIERYMQDIDRQKAELAVAQKQLTDRLIELRKLRKQISDHDSGVRQAQTDDISRLIAVYDQMKPEQAAVVLSNLPPDFAAQILVRVQPETGARIMAAVEPGQAAVLTSYMGSVRARTN
ncbi:MotE family protein [Paracoccus yeei]|uniref:MotE family protein n=1 Tax=Paracoccus yeei TaxID=147645 RepID=UPI003BF88197